MTITGYLPVKDGTSTVIKHEKVTTVIKRVGGFKKTIKSYSLN